MEPLRLVNAPADPTDPADPTGKTQNKKHELQKKKKNGSSFCPAAPKSRLSQTNTIESVCYDCQRLFI